MWIALLLLACRQTPDDPGASPDTPTAPSPTAHTADSGRTHDSGTSPGLCQATDHPLRFICPGTGTFSWWPEGEPERTRTTEASGEALIWGIPADTPVVVELPSGQRTTVTPGSLPVRVGAMFATTSGTASTQALALPNPCDGQDLLVVDDLGRIIWYQEFQAPVAAIATTPDDTFLVLIGNGRFLEIDLAGHDILNVTGFSRPLHHDLARDDAGNTYLLYADEFTHDSVDYVLDGLIVLDRAGTPIAEWDLRDHLDPSILFPDDRGLYWDQRFPGAIDFSHGNSVEVAPDGGVTLSFRWMHAAMHLRGDPTSPDFGEVEWVLASPQSDLPSDFDLVGDDPTFDGQHHVSVDDAGRVWLYDNGDPEDVSRGLRYQLDGDRATVDASWALPQRCAIQGAVYPTDDDGALLTCSQAGSVREYGPADTDPRWSMDLTCAIGPRRLLNRAVPVPF